MRELHLELALRIGPGCLLTPRARLRRSSAHLHLCRRENRVPCPGTEGLPDPCLSGRWRIDWKKVEEQVIQAGDVQLAEEVKCLSCVEVALPVLFEPMQGEGQQVTHVAMDWKLLTQLRTMASEAGLHGEPTRMMLNYIWGSLVLCPEHIKDLVRMIMTQPQQLLWQAHWQQLCNELANTPRGDNDPLRGILPEKLMGQGQWAPIVAQLQLGPDVMLESMQTAREAINRVRTAPPTPSYMSIKQGKDESFASFVNKMSAAMSGALLWQCVLENCNLQTKSILITLPADASIEIMLERMSRVPVGSQAFIAELVRAMGEKLGEKLAKSQVQAFAALGPLRPLSVGQTGMNLGKGPRCF